MFGMNYSDYIAVAAVILSVFTLIRQEAVQRKILKKTTTYSAYEMWNGEYVRNARTHVWAIFIKDRNKINFNSYMENPDIYKSINIIAHFFIETAALTREKYYDEKALRIILSGPLKGWTEFFGVFSATDGDGTLRFGEVQAAIKQLSR
ncbi:MAG TPA: hypothetical protein VG839_05405 [Asticcacaulis sp.]|nr:hypothetical protein [Asticcacaulis sp.]